MSKISKFIISIINISLLVVIMYFSKNIFMYYFFNKTLVTVPNVTNLEKEEAAKILKESNLSFNFINSRSNEVPINVVYNQVPSANEKVKINRAIKLYVNNEEGDKIPDLKNLPISKVMQILKDMNIEIIRVDYIQSDIEEDTVLASYPKEGSLIKYGEKISLLVSTRKLIQNNKMPNIIGYDISDGRNILKNLEYNNVQILGIVDENFPENMIVKTDPMPNIDISKNTEIKIYVSINNEEKSIEQIKPTKKEDTAALIDDIIKKALEEEKQNKINEKSNIKEINKEDIKSNEE